MAGPRVLEHIVDTVLYFEGDTHSSFRLIRAVKNRYGAVNEIGAGVVGTGAGLSSLVSGQVRRYALTLGGGAAVVLAALILRVVL